MIQSRVEEWIAACQLYHEQWESDDATESTLSESIRGDDTASLWEAAIEFRVARHFPANQGYRRAVAARVFDYTYPPTNLGFKNDVINLATEIQQVTRARRFNRTPFLVSAASKFLMLKFPTKGFVFDQNADRALWALAGAREWPVGPMHDERTKRLERYFGRWRALAEPLIQHLANHVFESPHASRKASRSVDKFLWIRGKENPGPAIDTYLARAGDWARFYGERAFARGRDAGLLAEHPW